MDCGTRESKLRLPAFLPAQYPKMREFLRDRGKKVRHSVCHNDSGCAAPHGNGPKQPIMAKGFFVDRAIEDAAFILERIDARWPSIVNSFSAKEP